MRTATLLLLAFTAVSAFSFAAYAADDNACLLQNVRCEDFDAVYSLTMYKQHSDISALAASGAARTSNLTLRDLLNKIVRERTDMNRQLASYYAQLTGCDISAAAHNTNQACCASTSEGCRFDAENARTLIFVLNQTRASADVGVARSVSPNLREQARIDARASQNEAGALQRWLYTGRTAPATQWEPLSEYCGVTMPGDCSACAMFTP